MAIASLCGSLLFSMPPCVVQGVKGVPSPVGWGYRGGDCQMFMHLVKIPPLKIISTFHSATIMCGGDTQTSCPLARAILSFKKDLLKTGHPTSV